MPVAIPTWRKVLLMPAPVPLSRAGTTLTALKLSGAFTKPTPEPGHAGSRPAGWSTPTRA